MANLNKLQQSKARVPGLSGSSDSQRRFQRFCARQSVFPPPPPVPSLTATQRLKRFKAILRKQQLAAANVRRSAKKSSAITLIVRKKGIRKSATPGKSPFVKSARKSFSRKELLRSAHRRNMKLLIAGMDNDVSSSYNNLDNGEQFEQPAENSHDRPKYRFMDEEPEQNYNRQFEKPSVSMENMCNRKKELLRAGFSVEKREGRGSDTKSSTERFVEYPDENGSSDSEEINAVNSRYEAMMSSHFSSNEIRHTSNGISNGDSHQNGNVTKNEEIDADSEDIEFKNSNLKSNRVSENASVDVPEIVEHHDNDEILGNTPHEKELNGGNHRESDEDSSFNAVLNVSDEKDLSHDSNIEGDEEFEMAVEAPETIGKPEETSNSRAQIVTAEIHAESNESIPETNNHEEPVESDAESRNKIDEMNSHEKPVAESPVSNEQSSKKKKPRKSSTPAKHAASKTPKKRPPKRKSSPLTPIVTRRPKSKKGSALEVVIEKSEEAVPERKPKKRGSTPIFKVAPTHIESHAYFSSGDSVLGSPTADAPVLPGISEEKLEDAKDKSKKRHASPSVSTAAFKKFACALGGTQVPGFLIPEMPQHEVETVPEEAEDTKSEEVAAASKPKSKRKITSSEFLEMNSSNETQVSASPNSEALHVDETVTEKAKESAKKPKSKKGGRKPKTSTADSKNLAYSSSEPQDLTSQESMPEIETEKSEAPVRKSKKKRGSPSSKSVDVENLFSETPVSVSKAKTSPFLEVVLEEAEKSLLSSDSENDKKSTKPSPTPRRSKFKWAEPVASCSKEEPSKAKAPVATPTQQDFAEPSTSGLRRTQRSFSPSRRAPLRSTRGSGTSIFESTPIDSTPFLKRKAESESEGESFKRAKEETQATPRWNLLSSPLKGYWSPQLTNKIKYKQPESSLTPDQFSISEDESSSSSDKANESDSKQWCTIS